MKQKFISLSVILFSTIFLPVFSQTEKGRCVLSGRTSLNYSYTSSHLKGDNLSLSERQLFDVSDYGFNAAVGAGYFVIDDLSIGGDISYSFSDGDYQYKNAQFVVMPTATYYFLRGKLVRPFLTLGVGYVNISVELSDKESKSMNGIAWGGGFGASFFVRDNISIDLLAQYMEIYADYPGNSARFKLNGIDCSVGFSIYF